MAGWAKAGEEAAIQAEAADAQAEGGVGLAEAAGDAAVFGEITGKLPPGAAGEEGREAPATLAGVVMGGPAAGTAELPPLPKRRRRREVNPWSRGIGMAMSGLLALVVGYYGLNFFGGKKFDMFAIYLPGVPHTYEHWRWYTPWKSAPRAPNRR